MPARPTRVGVRCDQDVFEGSSKHANPRPWAVRHRDPLNEQLLVNAQDLPEGYGAVGESRRRPSEEGAKATGRRHRRDGPPSSDQDAGGQLSGHPVQAGLDVPWCVLGGTGIGVADGEVRPGMGQHLLAVRGVIGKVPFDSPEAVDQSGQRCSGRVSGETHPLPQQPRVKDAAAVLLDRPRPAGCHERQAIGAD